jgi:hypothetical protein
MQDAATLSGGTIGNLAGLSAYKQIDFVRDRFWEWIKDAPDEVIADLTCWQDAWGAFWLGMEVEP